MEDNYKYLYYKYKNKYLNLKKLIGGQPNEFKTGDIVLSDVGLGIIIEVKDGKIFLLKKEDEQEEENIIEITLDQIIKKIYN